MLTISDHDRRFKHRGQLASRRDFLRIGSLGLGGLSLSQLIASRAAAGASGVSEFVKDKAVIFLFMHGGPSQIETFDPKMDAPAEIRSATGEKKTTLPGVTFGGSFDRLSQIAHKVSVVRSYTTGSGSHDIKPLVCKQTYGASLGAWYARAAGANHPLTGMPSSAALYPQAVDETTRPTTMNFGKFTDTGALGSGYAPFVPGAGGDMQQDMQLRLPMQRIGDRRSMLSRLDRARFSLDGAADGLDTIRQQAFDTILGGAAEAFDLSNEDPRTLARYDTAPLVRPSQIDRKWNNYDNYVDNAKSLGKLLLLARRLCEAGCGFITVTTNFVWDMHADRNNAGVEEGMGYMGLPFDHAVSALIEDLEARGLTDKILLVCSGEMGRTPKINNRAGRDHWGGLAPLLLHGGGLRMGQVVGQSTRDAGRPLSSPITIDHLLATIMGALFDVGQLRLVGGMPREMMNVAAGAETIPGLA